MSLHIRYCPCPFHAGPSHHMPPVHSRWIGVLPTRNALNDGSCVMMSGSGYVTGREKSRGGFEMTLGGSAFCGDWPRASAGVKTAAPIVARASRREIINTSGNTRIREDEFTRIVFENPKPRNLVPSC